MNEPPITIATVVAAASGGRSPAAGHHLNFCTFLLADRCFAIDAHFVAEVLRETPLTRVPLAAPAIAGLLNLRGRIVPVIDLRRRLGFPESAIHVQRINVVIDVQREWFSLLVDELLDVVPVDTGRIERPTGERAEPPLDCISGVLAEKGQLIHVLDPSRILQNLIVTRGRGLAVG